MEAERIGAGGDLFGSTGGSGGMTRDDRDDLLQCIGEWILCAVICLPIIAFFGAFVFTVVQLLIMIFEADAA